MAITMQDIQNEGFEHSLRGYDVEQVDVFLERVANEVDAMNRRIEELEDQLKAREGEIDILREQLIAADEAAEVEAVAEPEQVTLRDQEVAAELDVAKERASAEARRAEELEEKIAQLTEQLEEKNKLDNAISEAFIAAQRSADQIKEDARVEADRIYQESQAKAREFIRESLASKAALDDEVQMLQASAQRFRGEYLDMLDRFMAQAKQEFDGLDDISISDDQVDAQLPDIDSLEIPAVVATEQVQKEEVTVEEDDIPRITTDQIPRIVIPTVLPEEE